MTLADGYFIWIAGSLLVWVNFLAYFEQVKIRRELEKLNTKF